MTKKRQPTDNSLMMVAVVAIVAIFVLVTSVDGGLSFSFGEGENVVGQAGKMNIKLTDNVVNSPGSPVCDIEGNEYQTVWIGDQLWMAENLKTKQYNDGSYISYVVNGDDWEDYAVNSFAAYCDVNGSSDNFETYGLLYNAFAVTDERGICPIGFHVPSEDDWMELVSSVGGNPSPGSGYWSETAGGILKEMGTDHWNSPNTLATNNVGFTALPAGTRSAQSGGAPYIGHFSGFGEVAWFWSLTNQAWTIMLYSYSGQIHYSIYIPGRGQSVRCVANEEPSSNSCYEPYNYNLYLEMADYFGCLQDAQIL